MEWTEYKVLHSETIMFYQVIENDLKTIYAFMQDGDIDENYASVSTLTLGQIIDRLKNLENTRNKRVLEKQDYNFLNQIKDNRNFWAHANFLEFIYDDDFEHTENYKKQCRKLQKDHDRVEQVYAIIEQKRVSFCTHAKR